MPTKSNNMSPMPMQSKIGEASLKFGPDWLRALSSSETTGHNPNSSSPGGDAGSVGRGFGFSGWGGGSSSDTRTGFTSSNKEFSASSHFTSSSSPSYNHQQHYQSGREGKGGTPPSSIGTRFKPSESRYSREEMLALYDKNLEAPSFLLSLGTLFIEKMQPPLAFSQSSEEEIRIWHNPQPESSRQGTGTAPIGRGYATRGRGGGIERGRGRGRGGYYGRPHEEEERGSFSRPRNFERSQSNVERPPWGERNGIGGPGGPPGTEEITRAGGSWRSRESFGGRRHEENNEEGWRKQPRWRRGDEEEEGHRGNSGSRRLNRSYSEDENHDNLPEWARDNPSEESGTFDSSGAFHGDDRNSKSKDDYDRKTDSDSSRIKSSAESEPSGSQTDRVQKRNPDRIESVKPVIPSPVREESDTLGEKNNDYTPSATNRISKKQYSSTQIHPGNSIIQQKNENDFNHGDSERERLTTAETRQQTQQQHLGQSGGVASLESQLQQQKPQKQQLTNVQHNLSASQETRTQVTHSHQSTVTERNTSAGTQQHQQQLQQNRMEMRASNLSQTHETSKPSNLVQNRHSEEDQYRSMTEEALNLVSKLIEEDGSMSRSALGPSAPGHGVRLPTNAIPQQLLSGVNASVTNSLTNSSGVMNTTNDISRNSGTTPNAPAGNVPPVSAAAPTHVPSVPPASLDVWFYRDPQGSVQGPFNTQEMALWYSQGYFSSKLLLRRECDKIFITLGDMGKLYSRNPFAVHAESPPPPPIQDPNASALDFPRGDTNHLQAQIRQQQLHQQNILREQQAQYMLNMSHGGAVRKEEPGWQGPNNNIPQQSRTASHGPLTAEQIQAQLLMSMAKSQGLERDPNAMDQLTALFQRQLKNNSNSNNEAMMSQPNQKNDYGDMIPNRHSAPMDVPKSPVPATDAIQSLVQQLTSMANTQQHLQQQKINASSKPDVLNPWGVPPTVNPVQPQIPNQWGSHSNTAAWEYREQMALNQKLQQEEELRRRKEEEEAERKRLEEEERKRVEEQQRAERERKRLEEHRLEEEKQRKAREEQYLIQKKQQELLLKQQEEAEIIRQKELARQKEILLQRQMEQRQLEQQRQMRDEQTRLAEEQQQREQQRLEKERQEREQAEKELKLRQERERQEQAKLQQQFSWNAAPPPQTPAAPGKSLLEIQQEESIKQEKEAVLKKKQQQEQLRQQQQQQAQQQKAINLKWAQGAAPAAKAPIKSLTEIQAEEQAKLQKQQEKEREKRATVQHNQQQQQAWSSQLTWANRASVPGGNGNGNGGSSKSNGGVWDREETSMAAKIKSSSNNQSSNNRSQQPLPSSTTGKRLPDDSFMKLFAVQDLDVGGSPINKGTRQKPQQPASSGSGGQDDFTRWCFDKVQTIGGGNVDIPTFVGFLKEVESPFEVNDYVRSYLGDGKDARDFSREFLERRSRWKNARKDGGGSFEDNLCRPASAVNPNQNDFQEVKAKGKKTKKGKMQKVDSRILGFSTSGATDRLNVGNRDYGAAED